MHLLMIILALGLAWIVRLIKLPTTNDWAKRWQRSLFLFIFPPLLLLITAFAVLYMGHHGQMLGLKASRFSCYLAVIFLGWIGFFFLKLGYQGWLCGQQVSNYSLKLLAGEEARILETKFPYSAQFGFWQPQLVVSQGLLNILDSNHLEAVLAHEQAHCDYRDTFWFFWLGWLRSSTRWLPNTETLWQELLLLREIRADRKAAQQVDSLLIAESLLFIAQKISKYDSVDLSESYCAAFSDAEPNRLEERIHALLNEPTEPELTLISRCWNWSWILLTFLPLVTVPFHY